MRSNARAALACLPPVACCLCLLAFPLRGEVFWRLPKTSDAVLRQLGGERVYATGVQVNGAPGALTAYAFGQSPSRVGAGLSRAFGLPPPAPFGATFLAHAEKDRLRRLLVLPAASDSEACVVLAFDQPLRDAAPDRQSPPAWPEGVPALAATPLFTAVCALTRTAFVAAESSSSPEAAAQEAAQTLRAAGWAETAPSAAAFKLFVSGRKQCVLFAARAPQSGRTTISLLQREGATP